MSVTHVLVCNDLGTPALRGMNSPNHVIPDPDHCMPLQLRI